MPLHLLPFTVAELNLRLHALIAFGTDIFVLRNGESIRLWKHAAGYDADGLDYIINLRQKHYLRQRQERTLKEGDRLALLGRGIAVVNRVDEHEVVVTLHEKLVLRVALKDVALNQRNRRWECAAKPQLRILTLS